MSTSTPAASTLFPRVAQISGSVRRSNERGGDVRRTSSGMPAAPSRILSQTVSLPELSSVPRAARVHSEGDDTKNGLTISRNDRRVLEAVIYIYKCGSGHAY